MNFSMEKSYNVADIIMCKFPTSLCVVFNFVIVMNSCKSHFSSFSHYLFFKYSTCLKTLRQWSWIRCFRSSPDLYSFA